MDGIFGIGLAEMVIIFLALFIIGGPANTAKWAREAGRMVRKARQAWAQMMAELENELGPEGKELMDVTREIGQSAYELRRMASPRGLVNETTRLVDRQLSALPDEPATGAKTSDQTAKSNGKKYQAWLPPDEK